MSCSIGPSAESSEAAVGSGENSTCTLLQKVPMERGIHYLGRICRCLWLPCAVRALSGGIAGWNIQPDFVLFEEDLNEE